MPSDTTPDEQAVEEPLPEAEAAPESEPAAEPEPEGEAQDEDVLDAPKEEPLRSTVHPAAPAGFTEADADPEMGQFFIGRWFGKPNYGCPYCTFSTLDGTGAVELHILSKIDSGDIKHRAYAE